jgi:hypothetical protein
MKDDIFYIKFDKNWFYKGDILRLENNVKLKVLEDPHKKWWKQFFQFITFGLYKAPIQYKCKIIE